MSTKKVQLRTGRYFLSSLKFEKQKDTQNYLKDGLQGLG